MTSDECNRLSPRLTAALPIGPSARIVPPPRVHYVARLERTKAVRDARAILNGKAIRGREERYRGASGGGAGGGNTGRPGIQRGFSEFSFKEHSSERSRVRGAFGPNIGSPE